MTATMQDVATRAGVSPKTVSNVINNYVHVRPETRRRVEAAIADLGYSVNLTARNLRRGRTGMITLAVPELRVPYYAELADSVMRAAADHGLGVLIEQTGPAGEGDWGALKNAHRSLTDGLIFSPGWSNQPALPELLDSVDSPIVLHAERIFDERIDHVLMPNVEGAYAATAHLVERGCRNIALLGVSDDAAVRTNDLRREGYLRALADAGITPDARLEGTARRWVRSSGAEAMAQVLDTGVAIDGVFAMNDALALGALHVLQLRGVRVPDDVAIVGFDNIDDVQYSYPALSSIDPDRATIATAAVDLLVERIGGSTAPARRIVSSFHLAQRASTARS